MGRRRIDHAHAEIKLLQRVGGLLQCHRHAQDARHVTRCRVDPRLGLRHGVGVHHARHDARAGILAHQVGGAAGGDVVEFGGDAARKAEVGFAEKLERLARAPVVDAVKGGRFKQDGGCVLAYLALQPAHHAGNGNRAERVGDHQHRIVQLALDAVERGELLTGRGAAHDNRRRLLASLAGAAHKNVVVKGVQRLAPLQHDVVGDVHHVVDRAHPGFGQPILHPLRRGADLDVLDQRPRIAVAQRRLVDAHGHVVGGLVVAGGGGFIGRQVQRGVCERGDLAGKANQVETAPHVGRQVKFEHAVAQVIAQGQAHRRILRQQDNAFVLLAQPQLALGADHARRFNAANLGRLELFHRARARFAVGIHQGGPSPRKGHLEGW